MEGDAGTGRLNPTDKDADEDTAADTEAETTADTEIDNDAVNTNDAVIETETIADTDTPGGPTAREGRLSGRMVASVAAVLAVLAVGLVAVGYLLLQWNARSDQIARDGAVALQAAKDCVIATQAPDTASMGAAQAKIVECSTGDFGAQAVFYGSMLTEAYQAAAVQVEVADLRAAVERHHDDGSVDVLVAVRTKVTNSEAAEQEQGYRLRVTMQRDDGTYKIANLVQVST